MNYNTCLQVLKHYKNEFMHIAHTLQIIKNVKNIGINNGTFVQLNILCLLMLNLHY